MVYLVFLGDGPHTLSWEQRLQIALDVSHGIEYLHEGVYWIFLIFILQAVNYVLQLIIIMVLEIGCPTCHSSGFKVG